MVHFENSSTQVPKPMENPRKKKAQMKTFVRVGSPEENRIRLNKREKSRRKRKKKVCASSMVMVDRDFFERGNGHKMNAVRRR